MLFELNAREFAAWRHGTGTQSLVALQAALKRAGDSNPACVGGRTIRVADGRVNPVGHETLFWFVGRSDRPFQHEPPGKRSIWAMPQIALC